MSCGTDSSDYLGFSDFGCDNTGRLAGLGFFPSIHSAIVFKHLFGAKGCSGCWDSGVSHTESLPMRNLHSSRGDRLANNTRAMEGNNYMCERRGCYFIQSGQRKASQGKQPLSR